jgi:hypothetical protein
VSGDFHDESRMARETDARERCEIRREQDARWGAPDDDATVEAFWAARAAARAKMAS